MNIEKIKNSVPGKIYYKAECKSTNLDAKNSADTPDKSIFIADKQNMGRGRLGRKWSSPEGCGIWMSIYLKPEIKIGDIPQLTLIAGLAVSEAIDNSVIKWPNDILLGGKKVGGILTEMSFRRNEVNCVVVGIGINVDNDSFPDDLSDKATSLFIETGKHLDKEELICRILDNFFDLYTKFLSDGFSVFKAEYESKCITVNRDVVILKGDKSKNAKAVGITDSGELICDICGTLEIVNSNEVSVRGLLGYV